MSLSPRGQTQKCFSRHLNKDYLIYSVRSPFAFPIAYLFCGLPAFFMTSRPSLVRHSTDSFIPSLASSVVCSPNSGWPSRFSNTNIDPIEPIDSLHTLRSRTSTRHAGLGPGSGPYAGLSVFGIGASI